MSEQKLKYEFNPYTFARISVMKSNLLRKEDYNKLMKMDADEVIKFMQESHYSSEINKLSTKYSGIKLAEKAINENLIKSFLKLRMISDTETRFLIDLYLKRYDIQNLKTILRAKLSGVSKDNCLEMLIPVGSINYNALEKLYEMDVKDILKASGFVEYNDIKKAIERFEESKILNEIEDLLDYNYYVNTIKNADAIPKQGRLFREFFGYLIDIYNIRLLMKKAFLGIDEKYVKGFLIDSGKMLSGRMLNELLLKKDKKEFISSLNGRFDNLLNEVEEDKDPLLQYEIQLQRILLQKSIILFYQHPFTVDIVLGYMFYKEIEASNLLVIIKSKKLEYTDDYVKTLVVTR